MKQEENQVDSGGEEVRATIIRSNSREDQNLITHILTSFKEKIDVNMIVRACIKYPKIKEEPELVERIFDSPEVIHDIATWILNPLRAMQKTNFLADHTSKYPKTLKDFVTDNFNFYEYLYIKAFDKTINLDIWFEFLDEEKLETFPTALGYFIEMFLPFIRYQFSQTSQVCDYLTLKGVIQVPSVITLFSQQTLTNLIAHAHHKSIFQFLYNLSLAALQIDEWTVSLFVLFNLFKEASFSKFYKGEKLIDQEIVKVEKEVIQIDMEVILIKDEYVEQVCKMVFEISENIEKDKNNTVFAFIDNIIKTNLLLACRNRIMRSRLCVFHAEESIKKESDGLFDEEEDIVEYCLKIISEAVKIYYKLLKIEVDRAALNMKNLFREVEIICQNLSTMVNIVKNGQNKTVAFSTGSIIKPVTLVKYAFFQLLLNCLILVKEYPILTSDLGNNTYLEICEKKLQICELMKRYLLENKWNNILQVTLEKILTIIITTQFTKKSSQNYIVDKFLPFLIQNFASKKYVFLDSSRFTSLGNNYTMYNISKKVANVMKYPDLYKPWTNFVINNLQVYEEKINVMKYSIDEEQYMGNRRENASDLKTDELISVKELVKTITNVNKWVNKDKTKPKTHNSGIFKSGSSTELKNLHNGVLASATKKRLADLNTHEEEIISPRSIDQNQNTNQFNSNHFILQKGLEEHELAEINNRFSNSAKNFHLTVSFTERDSQAHSSSNLAKIDEKNEDKPEEKVETNQKEIQAYK